MDNLIITLNDGKILKVSVNSNAELDSYLEENNYTRQNVIGIDLEE